MGARGLSIGICGVLCAVAVPLSQHLQQLLGTVRLVEGQPRHHHLLPYLLQCQGLASAKQVSYSLIIHLEERSRSSVTPLSQLHLNTTNT